MAETAFVFIHLPDETKPTIAGRFDLETAVTPHVGTFVYAESYLQNPRAVPLDPVALPLKTRLYTTNLALGFFGVLSDAIPDNWGKHVAARLYGETFQSDFDYLFLPTADRVGALAFGRSAAAPIEERLVVSWEELNRSELLPAIDKIERDMPLNSAEQQAAIVFGAGTSAGGARPKLTVLKDNALWLAKLNRHSDSWNVVAVEAAMLDLARLCGILVPDHRLERVREQDVLLVKRFDRWVTPAGTVRHRAVSAATVFRADEAVARQGYTASYLALARELNRWTVTANLDCPELFRRVAFNCLCSVTDDHDRNHALLASGNHFRLAPAFDLVPQPSGTKRRYLAMTCGELGALATRENLLSGADRFLLSRSEANRIVDATVKTVNRNWRRLCGQRGVSDSDIQKIAGCFVPEFFERLLSEMPARWLE